jgi:hypothetical protein
MLTGLPTGSGWACMSKLYRGVTEVELQVLELKKRPTPASFHVMAVHGPVVITHKKKKYIHIYIALILHFGTWLRGWPRKAIPS